MPLPWSLSDSTLRHLSTADIGHLQTKLGKYDMLDSGLRVVCILVEAAGHQPQLWLSEARIAHPYDQISIRGRYWPSFFTPCIVCPATISSSTGTQNSNTWDCSDPLLGASPQCSGTGSEDIDTTMSGGQLRLARAPAPLVIQPQTQTRAAFQTSNRRTGGPTLRINPRTAWQFQSR